MHVPQPLVLFILRSNVDDDGVNPLSDQTLDALQSQFKQTVPVLQDGINNSTKIQNQKNTARLLTLNPELNPQPFFAVSLHLGKLLLADRIFLVIPG